MPKRKAVEGLIHTYSHGIYVDSFRRKSCHTRCLRKPVASMFDLTGSGGEGIIITGVF